MEKILWLLFVIQQLYTTESFRSRAASKSSPLQKFPPILTKKQTSQPTSSLFLTSSDDDLLNENYEEESFQPPLEQFFTVLQDSIVGETLLKLSLSENGFSSDDEEAQNDEENDINWEDVKGWTAISGRLIKTKGESKLQLISYKDKSMKKSDQSKNYTSSEEALKVIRAYIEKAYKKITLSTKESDFELKMRKGGGKFRATSKVSNHIDVESITSESISGAKDATELRRILEDRRLLLLSDPSNQEYKVLYAEAKQRQK